MIGSQVALTACANAKISQCWCVIVLSVVISGFDSCCAFVCLSEQSLTIDDDKRLTASDIPLSVVNFEFNRVTAGMIAELLATRSKRDLQRVNFSRISHSKVAALVAELVCTDPDKQWTLEVEFGETAAAVAFANAATDGARPAAALPSSLTDLNVLTNFDRVDLFASLLSATPRMTRFEVREDVVVWL